MMKTKSLVNFLNLREIGFTSRRKCGPPGRHIGEVIAEEKATLPTKNTACELSRQCRSTFLTSFSYDGERVASTHGDHSVRVTDVKTGKCSHVLTGHPRTPWCVQFHPTSNDLLATGCLAGEVRIWDLRGGGREVLKSEKGFVIASLAFHPTEQMLVVASGNELMFWDWSKPVPFATCKTNFDYEKVRWVHFDPVGHYLYTGIANSTTIQQDEVESAEVEEDEEPTNDRHRLRMQYRRIVQEIATHRSMRRDPTREPVSPTREDEDPFSDRVRRRASEVLSDARAYARDVTRSAQQEVNAMHTPPSANNNSASGRQVSSAPTLADSALAAATVLSSSPATAQNILNLDLTPDTNSNADVSSTSGSNGNRGTSFQSILRSRLTLEGQNAGRRTGPSLLSTFRPGVRGTESPNEIGIHRPSTSGNNSARYDEAPVSSMRHRRSLSSAAAGASASSSAASSSSPNTRRSIDRLSLLEAHESDNPESYCPENCEICRRFPHVRLRRRHGMRYRPMPITPLHMHRSTASQPSSETRPRESGIENEVRNALDRVRARQLDINGDRVRARQLDINGALRDLDNLQRELDDMGPSPSPTNRSGIANNPATASSAAPATNSGAAAGATSTIQNIDFSSPINEVQNAAPATGNAAMNMDMDMANNNPPEATNNNDNNMVDAYNPNGVPNIDPNTVNRNLVAAAENATASNINSQSGNASSARDPNLDPRLSEIIDFPHLAGAARSINLLPNPFALTPPGPSETHYSQRAAARREAVRRESTPQLSLFSTNEPFRTTSPRHNPLLAEPSHSRLGAASAAGSSRNLSFMAADAPSTSRGDSGAESASGSSSSSHVPQLEAVGGSSGVLATDIGALTQLDSRIRQLDQRVHSIQRRLNSRMAMAAAGSSRQLNSRQLGGAGHPSPRQRDRGRRFRLVQARNHLELIRSRYSAPRHDPPELPDDVDLDDLGSSLPPPAPSPSPANPSAGIVDRSRRLRQMRDDIRNLRREMAVQFEERRRQDRDIAQMQRRQLHPHYSASLVDDPVHRPHDLQAAINRAIAGAFVASGESSVASNIIDLTHRIQRWDFRGAHLPDLTLTNENVVIPHCKIHNDATCDISQDGRFLSVLVPSHRGFPDDSILGVFSLDPSTLGKCLYTKSFGPNAISVSISPLNNYVMVGLAAKRLHWMYTPKQMVAQIYRLKDQDAGEDSMEHICDLMHACDGDVRLYVSVNSARWLPNIGEGVIYGTNRGDLHICIPGSDEKQSHTPSPPGRNRPGPSGAGGEPLGGAGQGAMRRDLMRMLGLNVPGTQSIATQTSQGVRRTASTQTDTSYEPGEAL